MTDVATSGTYAEPVLALDPRYYTDADIYAREVERIFCRTWQFACHVSEVKQPGDYVVFEIADQSLFVVRDKQRALRCFYNVCQHRAHELLRGAGNRKVISCPYHAWTYGLDGRLRGAPNVKNVPGFDTAKICLSEVKLEVFCGFVFVNLDPEAEPLAAWYGAAAEDLRSAVPEIDRYEPIWQHSVDEDCNWKVAVENYNECYHCRFVHPAFTRGVIAADSVDIVPRDHTLRHTARGVKADNASYGFDADASDYQVIFLWPTMAIQVYPGRVVNTYWWRARSATRTTVYRGWLTAGGAEDPETMKIAEIDRETTFAEDLPILKSVQRGLASRGYRGGPLVIDPRGGVESELSIKTLQCWVREALEA